jgi:hypothetical protein
MTEPAAATETAAPEPRGIGGWLLLPIASLLFVVITGTWTTIEVLADPGMRSVAFSFQPPWMTIGFIGVIIFWSILPLIVVALLLMRSRSFPIAFIISGVTLVLFGFVEPLITALQAFDWGAFFNAFVPAFWVAGWSKYMLSSVRVRNTFVN